MKYLSTLPIAALAASLPLVAAGDTLRDGLHTVVTDGAQGTLRIVGGYAELSVAGQSCFGGTEGPLSEVVDRTTSFTDREGAESCTITIGVGEDG